MSDTAPDWATRTTSYRGDLFAGQTVMVSGGGSGIGRAIAWLFGRLGACVVICGRKPERLEASVEAMRAAGLTAEAIACNIRSVEDVAALFDKAGVPDILVNNAGGQFPQAAIDFSAKGWAAVIETNLTGTWNMMQAAAQRWRDAKRGGVIVNIVAVVDRGMPGVAHTCAARGGVIALSRTVAVEWAPLNIRINCVAPGAIETEGMAVYPPEARAAFPRSNPMLRMGDAWEVAESTVYLAAPSAGFVTGEVLTVDGGGRLWGELWTAGKPDYFKAGGMP
jgi:citronellol/citronellal dehydrogenase